ncbi:VWA domain-containing protein [Deinococcus yunweiensis]|uniref:VWA domain-containing protein n=1 Tax=Deinococcus yunweiensis TaxID=367282 RepID=UPI00398E75DE
MSLSAGQRAPLSALGLAPQLTLTVTAGLAGVDVVAFGLNSGRLADDRYMVFYNQPRSPDGAIQVAGSGFTLNLDQLSAEVTEIVFTATHDDTPVSRGALSVDVGGIVFDAGAALRDEKAAMLVRLYRHQGAWRLEAVGQGFNGGLDALVKHFGGEVADEAPAAPTPVNLKKERQRVLLDKAQQQAPELVSLIKAAQVSLEKRGLGDASYQVKLVLDISGSMADEYRSGSVQQLANRALALAARLDDDGQVDVYLFGVRPHRKGALSIENAQGFVRDMRVQLEPGTHYGPVMQYVREDVKLARSGLPTLVLFVTDGGTSNPDSVVRLMREMSGEPIFWKFMGIEQGRVNFDFLEKLDDLTGRVVDNADFFKVQAPIRMADDTLFDLLVNELDGWQSAARRAGVLR